MATFSKKNPFLTNNFTICKQTGHYCHRPKPHLELLDTLHSYTLNICDLVYKAGLVPGKQPQLDTFNMRRILNL
jgi:hypothetical protein